MDEEFVLLPRSSSILAHETGLYQVVADRFSISIDGLNLDTAHGRETILRTAIHMLDPGTEFSSAAAVANMRAFLTYQHAEEILDAYKFELTRTKRETFLTGLAGMTPANDGSGYLPRIRKKM